MWSGTLEDIPDGWVLCDGKNGTPDLNWRFIIAAGDPNGPHITGGTSAHYHEGKVAPDQHTHLNTVGLDGHTHSADADPIYVQLQHGDAIIDSSQEGDISREVEYHGHNVTIEEDIHGHVVNITPDSHDHSYITPVAYHAPRFYSLAYIMKL